MNVLKMLLLVLHICVVDVMLFNHQKCSETDWPEIHVSIFRMAAFGALLGIREGFLDLLLPRNTPGKGSTSILHDMQRITTSFVFRKPMGRMSSCRLFRCWSRNSGYLVRSYQTMSAGGSATCIHKNLLPDGAIVTHVITCQGRDHIVTIQSGDCVLVVNVHFEPDLTLRGLRERLRLVTPQWPRYPGVLGGYYW